MKVDSHERFLQLPSIIINLSQTGPEKENSQYFVKLSSTLMKIR